MAYNKSQSSIHMGYHYLKSLFAGTRFFTGLGLIELEHLFNFTFVDGQDVYPVDGFCLSVKWLDRSHQAVSVHSKLSSRVGRLVNHVTGKYTYYIIYSNFQSLINGSSVGRGIWIFVNKCCQGKRTHKTNLFLYGWGWQKHRIMLCALRDVFFQNTSYFQAIIHDDFKHSQAALH